MNQDKVLEQAKCFTFNVGIKTILFWIALLKIFDSSVMKIYFLLLQNELITYKQKKKGISNKAQTGDLIKTIVRKGKTKKTNRCKVETVSIHNKYMGYTHEA